MKKMTVERLSIAVLTPDPENARTHDDANVRVIAGSLEQFGQRKPIVITADNVIVAGNGTVRAAQSLGWSDIDAVRVPADWSDMKVKAFALADNRTAEMAEWNVTVLDEQLQALTFDGFEISAFGFDSQELPAESEWSDLNDAVKDRSGTQQMTFVVSDDQVETIQQALRVSKSLGEFDQSENVNGNGNALARVCEMFLGNHGG